MLVSDVILRVRRTFGDEAAVQVTDDDIIRWINDAQIEIVRKNESALQKTGYVNLVANQATYTLPTDLLILRLLRFKYTDMLSFNTIKYKNMQEFDESLDGWDGTAYSSGPPQFFTMYEDKATLFPIPDQSATNGLKVLYNQKPADVSAPGDSLSLPAIYHPTIRNYCLWQASLLDEDKDSAALFKSDFSDSVNDLRNHETKDPSNTYSVISVLEYDQ